MKSRIAQNILLLLSLGIPAFIFAALLYHRAVPVADELHSEINRLIAGVNEADGVINQAVLSARLEIASSENRLRAAQQRHDALLQRLQSVLSGLSSRAPEVLQAIGNYAATAEQKRLQVGDFSRSNSALGAAIDQIAKAMDEASSTLKTAPAKTQPQAVLLERLRQHLELLLGGLLEFTTRPLDTTSVFIDHGLQDLRDTLAGTDIGDPALGPVVDQLQRLISLIDTIHVRRPQVDRAVAAVVGAPSSQRLDAVQAAYSGFYDRMLARNESYRTGLLAYFALLTIGAVYFGLRWRSRDRMQFLQSVNETLEQRVTTRTDELTQAYEELKESQGRLVQSEKMSALGQMVAGVAHEINTPLAYSRSNVELVGEQLAEIDELVREAARQGELLDDPHSDGPELDQQLEKVAALGRNLRRDAVVEELTELLQASSSGLDQIAEMVMSLKNFSRVDRKKVERFNLNEGVDSALLIAQNKLKHKVTVVKNYGDIPPVTCAPSQINQVFLNMLVNAAQAIKDQGTITITTVANGDHVDVIFEDTGSGIPDDVLPHIFDPFYTTKDVGEGTGLGLSICYQIIDQHGGTISVDSQPGVGTRFTISLFIAEDETLIGRSLATDAAA